MVNNVSSEPLYGTATKREIEAIHEHMRDFTANVVKDKKSARKLLEEIGAIAENPDPTTDDGA